MQNPPQSSPDPPKCAGCADAPAAGDNRRRRLAVVFVALLAVIVGARTFLPDLLRPDLYKDDACQHIWWTYRFSDPALFPNDPIVTFFSEPSHAPSGWRMLYKLLVPWLDAQVLSEIISLVLALPTVVLVFLIGRRAYRPDGTRDAGAALLAGVIAVTWMLVRDDLGFVKGGFPRSFALPILLLGLWALMAQRGAWLGVAFLLGALFYPPVVINLGLVAAVVWLVRLARDRHLPAGWPALVTLGAVALAIILWVYARPTPPEIGPHVTGTEARAMPELGPMGRSRFFVNDPIAFYIKQPRSGLEWKPWALAATVALVIATAVGFRRAVPFEAWALVGTSLLGFVLSHLTLFKLYLPSRYVKYTLPVFLWLWLAAVAPRALAALERWPWGQRLRGALRRWPVLVALVVLVLGAQTARTARVLYKELSVPPPADHEAMLAFLTTLPKDTLVAAHPMDADEIPLRSRRSVLASRESAQPYFPRYYARIAERVAAELAACYTSDWKDVDALRDRYGVGVFVANAQRYRHLWPYFAPFAEAVQKQIERGQREGFVLQNPPVERVLFRRGDYAVVRVGPAR